MPRLGLGRCQAGLPAHRSATGSSAFASDGPEVGDRLCSEPSGSRLCRLSSPGWCGQVPGRRACLPDSPWQVLPAEPGPQVPGHGRQGAWAWSWAGVSWRDLASSLLSVNQEVAHVSSNTGPAPGLLPEASWLPPAILASPLLARSLCFGLCALPPPPSSALSGLKHLPTCPCPPAPALQVSSQLSPPWEASPDLSQCLRAPTLRSLSQGERRS